MQIIYNYRVKTFPTDHPDRNEIPQDARYSRQESILVCPLVPKEILSVRQTGICYSPMEVPLSSLRPQIATIPLFL